MSVTTAATFIIRKWEKCAELIPDGTFAAYWDKIGEVWTVGWGSTGRDVFQGVVWTQAQCDERNLSVITNLVEHVSKMVTYPVNEYQMAAMVSLGYNTGLDETLDGKVTAFGVDSTLLKYVNSGRLERAADEFLKWCHSHGGRVQGLYNRRVYERDVFLGNIMPG